ncbi:MAG: hypothetical protein A3H49_08035 [Nitrospirae bacterium RIFCSPLOWO2_02_FULL_62_14]|nr:MAG: hypothetical protein A3H49_08035 [Nitrospirae bacterium RIFCSPLOWO2_02_FULL_62_14]
MEIRCPRCGRDFVRRVQQKGLAEIVAGAACLYPFMCQLCAHRFRAFHRGGRHTGQSVDQRRYERLSVNFPVTFLMDAGQGNGTTLDISMEGCAFKSGTPPPAGTILAILLQAPSLERPLAVEAAVVRSVRSMYIGAEFLRLRPEEQYRLTQFTAGMLTDRRIKNDAASQ